MNKTNLTGAELAGYVRRFGLVGAVRVAYVAGQTDVVGNEARAHQNGLEMVAVKLSDRLPRELEWDWDAIDDMVSEIGV